MKETLNSHKDEILEIFDKAKKAGVKILCYNCKINDEEVKLNNQIELI